MSFFCICLSLDLHLKQRSRDEFWSDAEHAAKFSGKYLAALEMDSGKIKPGKPFE